MTDFIPYCGSPPFPGHVAWNTDPILATLLVISFAVSLRFLMSFHASRSQLGCLIAGWLVLSFALMSPLCNLSVALFTARAAQHITIAFIATPLIARSGVPAKIAASLLYGRTGARSGLFNPGPYIFALVFWFWHSGAPYDLTLQNNKVYWIMQLSIILCSIALWAALFDEFPVNRLHLFVASIFTGLQMSFLGAHKAEVESFAPAETLHMGLVGPDGSHEMYDGRLRWVDPERKIVKDQVDPKDYLTYIAEMPVDFSYLKYPHYKPLGFPKGVYRVGPLARLNVASRMKTPKAQKEFEAFKSLGPRPGHPGYLPLPLRPLD